MKRLFLFCVLALVACSESSTSTPAPDSGSTPDPDAGTQQPEEDSGGGGTECTAARKTHLGPIAKVSDGEVKVVSTADGVTTLYVDASAGGTTAEGLKNPRVYIKLSGEKVSVSDDDAFASAEWDLALKRVDIYTNSGDSGPGKGGAAAIQKDFDAVTAGDADGATIGPEQFFDSECNGRKDQAQFIITTMSGWYDYEVGKGPSAKPGLAYVVRAADGTTRYKVGFVSYTGQDDGSTNGQVTGRFILKIAKL